MKQSHSPAQPSSILEQQTPVHACEVPVSTEEFKRLRGLARTSKDFLHLASVCCQQAELYRLQRSQSFAAQNRHRQETVAHYRELTDLWNSLAGECLERAGER